MEHCPFCDGAEHHNTTHRLFGSTSSASSIASSPTISEMGMTPLSPPGYRRGSLGTIDEGLMSPLSRTSSQASLEYDRSQRARDMNDRIYVYLASEPHDLLPSARKNYPTYATAIARVEGNMSSQESSSSGLGLPRRLRRRDSFRGSWKRMSGRLSFSSSNLFKLSS